jgi:hypothetical protein
MSLRAFEGGERRKIFFKESTLIEKSNMQKYRR